MYKTTGQEDTDKFGRALGGALSPGDSVLLAGTLGMGKSVLARGIARSLGIVSPMPSPTFTLMQPYEGRVKVNHFDLYRLEDMDEFEAAGLNEYIGGEQVALIEWPLEDLVARPQVFLTLSRGEATDERLIALSFDGMGEAKMAAVEKAIAPWEEKG